MNIVLIGYRGTGKSVVSKIISKKLDMKRISTDEEIVNSYGPILEIVSKNGWDKFRDIEADIVAKVSSLDNVIIDCGGGVVLRPGNIGKLKDNGKVFLLSASVEKIANRIKDDKQRPSLKEGKTFISEIEEVLKERREKYNNAKDFEINTDKLTKQKVADKIIELFRG